MLAIGAVISACLPAADSGSPEAPPSQGVRETSELDCEREGYPCTRVQVAPEVLDLESRYVADINTMLDAGSSYADVVAWIRDQDGVVAAEADDHEMFFRLKGGQPLSFSEILTDPDAPPIADDVDALLAGVVGHGTPRESPKNHKRALLLDPLSRDKRSGFSLVRPGLEAIPDYQYPAGVTYQESVEVTPASFGGWALYDAIFVATHGGLKGGSWLATGIYEPRDPDEDYDDQCDAMMEADWTTTYRARCALFDHAPRGATERVRFIGVVVTGDYFRMEYGRTGGLQAAIVYIGGCNGLNMTDIREALAGASSAFVGWTEVTVSPHWENATVNVLHSLIRGLPIEYAVAVACGTEIGCHVASTGAQLQVHPATGDARKLRLYDVPTAISHPSSDGSSTSIGPLQDGARVPIIGIPGDGLNDEVELMIDFIGVVDLDASGDLVGRSGVRLASEQLSDGSVAQASDAARRYRLAVQVNGVELVRDNLGEPRHPGASVTPLDQTAYRYAFTAELPFDVDRDGTPATIKVVVDLPEGGISDYEIDVVFSTPCPVTPNGVVVPFDLPPGASYVGSHEPWPESLPTADAWRVGSLVGAAEFMRGAIEKSGHTIIDEPRASTVGPDDESFGLTVIGPCFPGGGSVTFIRSSTLPPTMVIWQMGGN